MIYIFPDSFSSAMFLVQRLGIIKHIWALEFLGKDCFLWIKYNVFLNGAHI